MNYAAIPTMYNGVQFRSRLEAKWAAFFDLMRWKWRYEPVDLDGWIPDFVIGDLATGAYIEVKPVEWFTGAVPSASVSDELNHAMRAVPHTSRGFLALGVAPNFEDITVRLGPVWEPGFERIITANLYKHIDDGLFDVPVGTGGHHPGLFSGREYSSPDHSDWGFNDELERVWKRACNAVQYRKPRGMH